MKERNRYFFIQPGITFHVGSLEPQDPKEPAFGTNGTSFWNQQNHFWNSRFRKKQFNEIRETFFTTIYVVLKSVHNNIFEISEV